MCGDINIDLMKHDTHAGTDNFINNLFSFGMIPLIKKPSRITSYSSTLIDNIFTNQMNQKIESGLLISDVTDHLPIFCIVSNNNTNNDNKTGSSILNWVSRRLENDQTVVRSYQILVLA